MASIKQKDKAFEILKDYQGGNPYLLMLKKQVYVDKDTDAIKDFQTEYILENHDKAPRTINKVVKITKECGENKQQKWGTEFIPEKIKIITLLGETKTTFHCVVQYRKSAEPVMCFLKKRDVITNFFVEDYHNVEVDFERYNNLMALKNPDRKMMEHQKEGVQFLLSRKKCILADQQGLGKSMTLSVAAIEGNFDSVVIICPASLKINWKEELMWFVPEKDITIVEGALDKNKEELEKALGYGIGKSGKKKDELLEEFKERGKWVDNRFVIVNYDILDEFYKIPKSWAQKSVDEAYRQSPLLQYVKNKKSLLIIDEAHNLSKSSSIRYKVIRDLIKRGNPDSIFLATGTPITNNPQNLFYILQLINDPSVADYKYYAERYCGATTFLAKGEWKRCTDLYLEKVGKTMWAQLTDKQKAECSKFIDDNGKHITVAKEATNLDELKERIAPIYLRREKDDFNDMPEKTIHEVFYELSREQKKKYDKLWEEYEEAQMELDPEKELNKDLLEGSIYRSFLSEEMVPYTIQKTNELIKKGEKVVIACCYDKELYELQKYYKDKCVIFNGKINAKQKDNAVKEFMNNPEIMVFIGNIKSCGVGLTLTSSCNLIFNNMEFVYANNAQMQDRVHRIGQKRDVHIYYQIFRDTQYETMWNIVLRKQTIFNTVIKKESDK